MMNKAIDWQASISLFEEYLRLERGLAENTVMAYLRDIKKLQYFSEEILVYSSPLDIEYAHIQEYLYQQSQNAQNARSQARWISSIKAFFNFLAEEEYREDSPAQLLQTPKMGLYLPDTLSLEEINALIGEIPRGAFIGERNYCMLEVLYGCGLRVSELTALKISHVNFQENYLEVWGKGNKMRLVPLAKFTQALIENYIKEYRSSIEPHPQHSDTLFLNSRGKGLTRVFVFTMLKELALKANIKKNISPHTFRHSYATHLLQNGADLRFIQEMLGHSSITTTEIYTHLETEDLRKTILQHHPRNKPQ